MDATIVIKEFIKKYGEEEYYLQNIETKFNDWLENTNEEELKKLLIQLFNEFRFFSRLEMKEIMKKQLKQTLLSHAIEELIIFPLPSSDNKTNSSNELTMWIREIMREENISFYPETIETTIENLKNYSHISTFIFFDDISGSGGTVIKFLKKYKSYLLNKKVVIHLIVVTEEALNKINHFLKNEPQLNVLIIKECKYTKFFLNHPTLKKKDEELLRNFETEIWGKGSKQILGFNNGQLLLGFSHNIPNNTFSCVWYDSDFEGEKKIWSPLFKRIIPLKHKNIKSQNRQINKRRN